MDWMNWKTWTIIGLIIVALFAIYAFAATQSARTPDLTPPPRPTTTRTAGRGLQPNAPGVGMIHMEWLETQSGSYRSERNLFAYKEPPPPPPPPPPPAPVPVPVQPVVPQPPPPPAAPVPPQFAFHYIGTFGTANNPIATFSGNGEIVNVRVGETIDGKFILRSIGIESVEIGYVGFPADVKTRIPIGQ
jgi:hypothetical protein